MARRRLWVGLVLVGMFAVPAARGQDSAERAATDVIAKIKEEGLNRSKAMETISYLTDVYGPRLTGSPQIRKAAEWTQSRLKDWGLADVHLEPWGPFGRGWSLEGFTANLVEPDFAPLIAYPKAWVPSTPQPIRGTPIYLEAANEKDLDQYRGKLHRAIVLLGTPRELKAAFEPLAWRQSDSALLALSNGDSAAYRAARGASLTAAASAGNLPQPPSTSDRPPPPPTFNSTPEQRATFQLQNRKWQLLYEEGAAVVIEPGRGDGGTVFVSSATLPSRSPTPDGQSRPAASGQPPAEASPFSRGPRPWASDAPPIVPQVVMAVEHYNRIVRMLKKEAPVTLEIDIASRYHTDDPMSFNVIAEIPGGDLKDEVVMLGAHFDSWHAGTGATDNAVGCGVALEAVRILRAIGVQPRRTIRLALWTGEEQGLLGSRAYVSEHFGRAITPPSSRSSSTASGSERQNGAAQDGAGPERSEAEQANGTAKSNGAAKRNSAARSDSRPRTRYELKPAHEKFSAYFNLDNGTGKIRGIYLQGNEAVRPIFRAWLAPFASLGAATIAPTNTGGTDHLSFDAVGLPGFQFIQDPLEYDTRTHHSSMDVFDRLQADDVKQAAVIMASFVYQAAMRDERLPRKPLAGEIITASGAPQPAEAAKQ